MMEQYAFTIDTNVLIDFYEGRRGGSAVSKLLVNSCIARGIPLLVACHQLKDLFYCMQLALKGELRSEGIEVTEANAVAARELAWSCVLNAAELFEVVGADASDVWLAAKYRATHPDFEDNLVIASAIRGNATHLVTNDAQLLRNTAGATSLVHAVTPEEALALVAA